MGRAKAAKAAKPVLKNENVTMASDGVCDFSSAAELGRALRCGIPPATRAAGARPLLENNTVYRSLRPVHDCAGAGAIGVGDARTGDCVGWHSCLARPR